MLKNNTGLLSLIQILALFCCLARTRPIITRPCLATPQPQSKINRPRSIDALMATQRIQRAYQQMAKGRICRKMGPIFIEPYNGRRSNCELLEADLERWRSSIYTHVVKNREPPGALIIDPLDIIGHFSYPLSQRSNLVVIFSRLQAYLLITKRHAFFGRTHDMVASQKMSSRSQLILLDHSKYLLGARTMSSYMYTAAHCKR